MLGFLVLIHIEKNDSVTIGKSVEEPRPPRLAVVPERLKVHSAPLFDSRGCSPCPRSALLRPQLSQGTAAAGAVRGWPLAGEGEASVRLMTWRPSSRRSSPIWRPALAARCSRQHRQSSSYRRGKAAGWREQARWPLSSGQRLSCH